MNGNKCIIDTNAIIASTAIVKNLPLITVDKGFKKIKELDLILINP